MHVATSAQATVPVHCRCKALHMLPPACYLRFSLPHVPPLQILKRINAEIEARRKAGEDLPPPPKTAIAGPEYFGLNQPTVRPVSCGSC